MMRTARTPKKGWRETFLSALRETGNVSAACKACNRGRTAIYELRQRDPQFAAAWDDALEEAVDGLEQVAWDRAHSQSDTLLIFLLKAHRPERYRETVRSEHTGKDGSALKIVVEYADSPPDAA